MKGTGTCLSILAVSAFGLGLAPADAPGTPAPAAQSDVLRRFAGAWDATIQMAGVGDALPQNVNGVELATLGGGGVWLVTDFKSLLEGRPFQGHSILTYDPGSGRYRRLWADSTSPAFWSSEGTYDHAAGTLTMWIESSDSDGHAVRWREVTTWKDADTRTFTMFVPGPDTVEAAGMTIVYRRRKDLGASSAPLGGIAAPAPSPEHALVTRDAGGWKATVENRMEPGRRAGVSKATELNTVRCGGLFLVREFSGTLRGKPFFGHGLLGYDPQKNKFISAWIDTSDPRLVLGEGSYDAARKTLTLSLPASASAAGGAPMREVLEATGPDERVRTRYLPQNDGGEKAGLTIRYRRAR